VKALVSNDGIVEANENDSGSTYNKNGHGPVTQHSRSAAPITQTPLVDNFVMQKKDTGYEGAMASGGFEGIANTTKRVNNQPIEEPGEDEGKEKPDEEYVVAKTNKVGWSAVKLHDEIPGGIEPDIATLIARVKDAVVCGKPELCAHASCAYYEDVWGDNRIRSPSPEADQREGVAAYYPKAEQAALVPESPEPLDPLAASVRKALSAGSRSRPIPGINPAKRQYNPPKWFPPWLKAGYKLRQQGGNAGIEEEKSGDHIMPIRGGEETVEVHDTENDPELWRHQMARHMEDSIRLRENDTASDSKKDVGKTATPRPSSPETGQPVPVKPHWVRRSTRSRNFK
jgi:hypothetical protein